MDHGLEKGFVVERPLEEPHGARREHPRAYVRIGVLEHEDDWKSGPRGEEVVLQLRVLDRGSPNVARGFRFSLQTMWPEVSRLRLQKLAPTLQIPVFLLVRRKDHWVPRATSVAYFDVLTAPLKKLLWFEGSGHEVFVDEADAFNAAMAQLVRPAVA